MNAIQDSWVQVRDAGGELLLTRVLRAGEIYRVPDEPGLTLVTGNAGGLEILVDGESLGIMGPVGKVRRDVNPLCRGAQGEPGRRLGAKNPARA